MVVHMKVNIKAVSILLCALFVISPLSAFNAGAAPTSGRDTGDSVPRIVLGELFSAVWCGPCYYGDVAMDNIVKDNTLFDSRFVLIEWHTGGGSPPNDDNVYACADSGPRSSYYSVSGIPTAVFDGVKKEVGANGAAVETTYRNDIKARPATSDTFIEIDVSISGSTLNVWANASLLKDTDKTSLYLRAVLVDDENVIHAGSGKPLRMTAKDMIFSTSVQMSKAGDVGRAYGTTPINGSWNLSEFRVVAFLQSDTDKEVLNAGINYLTHNEGPKTSVTVNPITMNEDTTDTSIHMGSMFTDPEGDPITLKARGSTHINATLDGSNVVTLQPWVNWSGAETITLIAMDAYNIPVQIPVLVTVTAVNDPPIRIKNIAPVTMLEGSTKKDLFNIVSYFSDIDDATLTYTAGGSTNVTATIKPSGLVTLVAPVGFNGKDTITFTATDAGGLKATADCVVTVTDVNFPPTKIKAMPDVTMNEDSTSSAIKLSDYFGDVDTPALTYTFSGNDFIDTSVAADTTLTLAPKADWNGIETITISVSDTVNKEVTDDFIVTVTAVNDAPVLTGAGFEDIKVAEDTDYTTTQKVDTLFKDVDSTLTYSIEGGDAMLTITLNDDLTVLFHPAANWFGSEKYTIKATDGQYTTIYNATVTYDAVNDAPVIESYSPQTLSQNINEGQTVDFNVVASDVDTTDVLVYTWTSNGKDVGSNSGSYSFVTDFNSTGTYTIKVVVTDGKLEASKTWTIKVKNVNRVPTVSITAPLPTDTFRSDKSITFTALGDDLDGDTLTYSWSMDGMSMGPTSSVTYKVPAGTHVIKVTALDGKGGTATAQMTITVKNMEKKTVGTSGVGTMLPILLIVVVVVVIIVLVVALKMKGKKKAAEAPQTESVAQLPPPPPQFAQGSDPNAYQGYAPVQYNQGGYPPQQPPQQ